MVSGSRRSLPAEIAWQVGGGVFRMRGVCEPENFADWHVPHFRNGHCRARPQVSVSSIGGQGMPGKLEVGGRIFSAAGGCMAREFLQIWHMPHGARSRSCRARPQISGNPIGGRGCQETLKRAGEVFRRGGVRSGSVRRFGMCSRLGRGIAGRGRRFLGHSLGEVFRL